MVTLAGLLQSMNVSEVELGGPNMKRNTILCKIFVKEDLNQTKYKLRYIVFVARSKSTIRSLMPSLDTEEE